MAKGPARARAKPARPASKQRARPDERAGSSKRPRKSTAPKTKRLAPAPKKPTTKKRAPNKPAKKPASKKPAPKPAKKRAPKPKPDRRAGTLERARKAPAGKRTTAAALAAADRSAAPDRPLAIGIGSSPTNTVVQILDADDPVAALRDFLDAIPGPVTPEQGQVALGAAQLALLPMAHENRGGPEVKQLLDLVLERWNEFSDRTGFHAQELLRNAFAAVGDDRDRIAKLVTLVPIDASPELRYNVAAALAVAGQRDAMLRAIEAALAVGASTGQFIRDPDFAELLDDPELRALLSRATAPRIPVDPTPHVVPVRAALESVIATLGALGDPASVVPAASLDAVLAAEQVAKIQLPNEYRALLTITDGPRLWEYRFLGTADFHGATELAGEARSYFETAGRYGPAGIDDCVPLANCGQPNDWLLYDPHGRIRGGRPGIVMMQNADEQPFDGLISVLEHLETVARDVLETN
ncbi:MAG TPA: SMI1/KNR4 family protein [Kofleriaceae bacterium]